jgi:hypothetical protein
MKSETQQLPTLFYLMAQEWEITHIESYSGGGKIIWFTDGINSRSAYLDFDGYLTDIQIHYPSALERFYETRNQ